LQLASSDSVPSSIDAVKKELRPFHDAVSCDVCGRTILKGERAESYLAPGGERKLVCDLCAPRALHEGWIRESGPGDLPAARRRPEQGGSLFGRLLRRRGQEPVAEEREPEWDEAPREPEPPPRERATPQRDIPRDPRHVRAVPTTAEAKIDRALDLFNGSDHQRTIAGLARTLGTPHVSTQPDTGQGSQVSVVIAWELSWYRYRVDLGDEGDPVMMLDKGEEIEQIEESLRDWNATLDSDGRVLAGHAVTDGGSEG
jgi:hypothetical protein